MFPEVPENPNPESQKLVINWFGAPYSTRGNNTHEKKRKNAQGKASKS